MLDLGKNLPSFNFILIQSLLRTPQKTQLEEVYHANSVAFLKDMLKEKRLTRLILKAMTFR